MLTGPNGKPIQPTDSAAQIPALGLPIGISALGYLLFGLPGSLIGGAIGLLANNRLGIATFGEDDKSDDELFGPDPEEKSDYENLYDNIFGPDPEVSGESNMPPWTPDSYGYSDGGYGTFTSYGTGNPSILNSIPTADGGSTPAMLYPDASFGSEGHSMHQASRAERTDHGSVFHGEPDEKDGEKVRRRGTRFKHC
jgi:hypothetical protein